MLTLADGRERVDVSLTEPAGFSEGEGVLVIPTSALSNLINATPHINKPDLRLSATASDTVPDQPLHLSGNATTYGASNYEGSVTVLRQTDASGRIDSEEDELYAAIGEKGVRAWYFYRKGPVATVALATGDEGYIYEAISDEPQEPTDRAGYIKSVISLGIQGRRAFRIGSA
jgi:hypothetical protein